MSIEPTTVGAHSTFTLLMDTRGNRTQFGLFSRWKSILKCLASRYDVNLAGAVNWDGFIINFLVRFRNKESSFDICLVGFKVVRGSKREENAERRIASPRLILSTSPGQLQMILVDRINFAAIKFGSLIHCTFYVQVYRYNDVANVRVNTGIRLVIDRIKFVLRVFFAMQYYTFLSSLTVPPMHYINGK